MAGLIPATYGDGVRIWIYYTKHPLHMPHKIQIIWRWKALPSTCGVKKFSPIARFLWTPDKGMIQVN